MLQTKQIDVTADVKAILDAANNGAIRTLLNVEDGADVTDTANVTAAGALMDSEVTNLAAVKAFDPTDYATAAQGATADTAMQDLVDDTTPTLGGDLDCAGNDITDVHEIHFDSTPDADHTANGLIATETVDVNAVGFGAALYRAADFHLETADADAETTMPVVALALETGTGSKKVLRKGYIRDDTWNWSAGLIFASTTTGGLTQTAPSGTGDIVQIVGEAVSADIMYFNPQLNYVKLV